MGLDFLKGIQDREGAAIYLLHDGGGYQERRMTDFMKDLQKLTQREIQIFSARESDGAQLADFYDILEEKLPAILIVRDNDSLSAEYNGLDLPRAEEVAYQADQVSD